MAVAGNADPMLGYLTTSFREHPRLRSGTGRRIATPMEQRLRALAAGAEGLYAAFAKAGGDTRPEGALCEEAARKVRALAARGFDLGCGHGPGFADPPAS